MNKHIVNGIILIVIFIAYILLVRSNKKLKKNHKGEATLRMPKLFLLLSIGFIHIMLFVLSVPIFIELTDDLMLTIMILMSAFGIFIGGFGVYAFFLYVNHKVIVDDEKITVISIKNQSKTILFKEIEEITYNSFKHKVIIHSKDGTTLQIFQYLLGILPLLETIENKTWLDLSEMKSIVDIRLF